MSIEDKRAWFKVSPNIRRLLLDRIDHVNQRVLRTETTPVSTSDDLAPDPERLSDDHVVYETRNVPPSTIPTFPGDLRHLMSPSSACNTAGSYKVNKTLTYTLKKSNVKSHSSGVLIDCGANGGPAGADGQITAMNPDPFLNIEGIDCHQVTNIPVVTCGAYTVTKNHGPVILIFPQFAGIQKGPSILLAGQLEALFHNKVNKRSLQFDPKGQLITTNDGFKLPLNVRKCLAYLDMRRYTDAEWDSLLHVLMVTSDVDWDPSILDGEFPTTTSDKIHDAMSYNNGTNFNVFGNYKLGTIVASAHVLRDHPVITTVVIPDDPAVENGALETSDHESIAYADPQMQLPPKPSPVSQGIDFVDTCEKEFSNLIALSPHISTSKLDPSSLRELSVATTPTTMTGNGHIVMHQVRMEILVNAEKKGVNIAGVYGRLMKLANSESNSLSGALTGSR
jgi:hypothetical protein